ncbi:MAG: hypothetical protein JNK61_09450 [Bacteroidia bacterium]|nr:hypothetical protein [Bacteroidia bacterium]
MLFFQLTLAQNNASTLNQFLQTFNDTATVASDAAPMQADEIMAKKWNQWQTKYFSLNLGLALFLDYNLTEQNETSKTQVGSIADAVEFRAQRLILSGNLFLTKRPWRYMISFNYNGMDAPQGSKAFSLIDLNLEIPFGHNGGWITVGKQKEGVGHEYVAPGSQLSFTERGTAVPSFVKQRNIGFRYSNSILNHRLAFTIGAFNNALETANTNSFSANGYQFTTRATGLVHYKSDRSFVHVGAGWRYADAPKNKLSYKAKPETNTAPYFLNTNSFDAQNAQAYMFELIGTKGPLSLISEYMLQIAHTPESKQSLIIGNVLLVGLLQAKTGNTISRTAMLAN